MMVEQLPMCDIAADIDIEEIAETGLVLDLAEQLHDVLRALVIRCDAGADQSVGRGQPVEDIDLDASLLEQLIGGIHGSWSGSDDRDAKHLTAGVDLDCLRHRRLDRKRSGLTAEDRVDVDERQLIDGQLAVGHDRTDGTGADTRSAVDTGLRVDVKHLGGQEIGLVGRRVDAVDGAGVDAGRVTATRLGHDMRHGDQPSQTDESETGGSLR